MKLNDLDIKAWYRNEGPGCDADPPKICDACEKPWDDCKGHDDGSCLCEAMDFEEYRYALAKLEEMEEMEKKMNFYHDRANLYAKEIGILLDKVRKLEGV